MDSKWLNRQFEIFPAKSKQALAESLGIQASGISKMLAGTRQIKAREYLLMRKFFDMPGDGSGAASRTLNIQSYDHLAAEDSATLLWTGKNGSPHYEVVEVSDSGMMPDFLPGERVLIDTRVKNALKPGLFAIEDQGKILIRSLEASGPKVKISALAKDVESRTVPVAKISIKGRVIAKLNWL